jgi:dienelactone hydrolase
LIKLGPSHPWKKILNGKEILCLTLILPEYKRELLMLKKTDRNLETAVQIGKHRLQGDLFLPEVGVSEIILFAHGSGSSRHSSRNRYVARVLNEAGLGTLLLDLLTTEEEAIDSHIGHLRFDIELLAKRLIEASDWLEKYIKSVSPANAALRLGYFGASTGAGAALLAAAEMPRLVRAIVSRGGRPDLAGEALALVQAPTLLIVGGADTVVIDLNRQALKKLSCPEKELAIIPGATHLFEEAGALEKVAHLAQKWFEAHLQSH